MAWPRNSSTPKNPVLTSRICLSHADSCIPERNIEEGHFAGRSDLVPVMARHLSASFIRDVIFDDTPDDDDSGGDDDAGGQQQEVFDGRYGDRVGRWVG